MAALVADMSDYESDSIARISESKLAFFISSTFGEGDPPDNVHDFWSWTESTRGKPLRKLQYFAFGLGNSNYKHYNAVIDDITARVEKLGATAMLPTGRADDVAGETEEHFSAWKATVLQTLKSRMGLAEHDPIYEPSLKVFVDDLSLDKAIVSHGVPMEQAARRAAARTVSPIHALQVKSSHELFDVTNDRNCLHMEIDLSGVTGLKYKTGDHLAVFPTNPDAEVARLARSLGLSSKMQSAISIEALEEGTKPKVPSSTTISALLSHYLEITASVSRDVVASLVEFAPSQEAKERLLMLSKDAKLFHDHSSSQYVNLGRLLEYADSREAAWSSIPLSFVVEVIPAMRPRYYSISSSSVVQPRQAAITAVVADKALSTTGASIPGLATNYLLAMKCSMEQTPVPHPRGMAFALDGPQDLLRNGKIFAQIRKSQFKLPSTAARPVIMVGAGTGVAPFRAFLQERATLLRMGREVGRTMLFFGCRNECHDFIYKEEFEEVAKILGERFSLITAFSRPDTGGKAYVQDRVKEYADGVCDLLVNQDAHFYICGSAAMAREVSNRVSVELKKRLGWDEQQLKEFAESKKKSRRWQQDVWG